MASSTQTSVLQVRDLRVSFDSFELSIDELGVPKGLTLLLGENGAGKTTLMRAVAGYLVPDAGRVNIEGQLSNPGDVRWQRLVAFVEDRPRVPKYLTLNDFLKITAASFDSQWDAALAERLLNTFELPGNRQMGKLSRGMAVKALIVVAAAACPALLLMDEPTAVLDPLARHEFLQLLSGLAESGSSRAMLMSTHLLEDVSIKPTQIIVIARGRAAKILFGDGLDDFISLPVEEKIREIAEWTKRNPEMSNA